MKFKEFIDKPLTENSMGELKDSYYAVADNLEKLLGLMLDNKTEKYITADDTKRVRAALKEFNQVKLGKHL